MKFISLQCIISIFISSFLNLVSSQISNTIVLVDKKFENEPYFHDLSYLNSNFTNHESLQNKFSTRERNGMHTTKHSCNQIRPIPSNIRTDLKLSYFYQKYTEAYGIPVIGSNKVSINGLKRACYVLRFYLASSNELKETFYKRNLRIVVLATTENILNVPEYNSLPSNWNMIRGLSPTLHIPLVTVSEENLQCSNDKYRAEDLLVHELSYALLILDGLSSDLRRKLDLSYSRALTYVPWAKTFSLVDIKEYLASGIDVYLNSFGKKDSLTFTLDDLKSYDMALISIIQQIFSCDNTYINKCKTTREMETNQNFKLGYFCEPEIATSQQAQNLNLRVSTSEITTEQTRYTFKNDLTQRLQQITTQQPTTVQKQTDLMYTISRVNNRQQAALSSTPATSTYFTTTSTISYQPNFQKTADCENLNENCESWALKGECNRNRQYMNLECKRSCGMCEEKTTKLLKKVESTTKVDISVFENLCKDEFTHCRVFALKGDCKLNPHYMLQKCMRSCNLCGDLVEQKDRIQPTSKKPSIRRPSIYLTPSIQSSNIDSDTRGNNFNFNYNYINNSPITETTTTAPTTTTAYYYTTKTIAQNLESCKDLVDYCSDLAERGDCTTNEATMQYYCPKSCKIC